MTERYIPPEEIIKFITDYPDFCVLGHSEPDGDCLGSQLAISILLQRLGKKVSLCSPGPFRRPEIKEFEPLFMDRIPEEMKDCAVLIMDCSTMERIGEGLKDDIAGLPVGVIDHHGSGEKFGDVQWILPAAPAVTLMVLHLYSAFGIKPGKSESEYLFLGLATDTGYFRHLDASSAGTFEAAESLVKAGVNPKEIFHRMNGNRSLESKILLGRLLARTEPRCGGKVLVTWETLEEKNRFGEENRDSDILYMQLQSVSDAEVIILVREESEDLRSVGLRSLRKIDVGALAGRMGGGGHQRAAGFNTRDSRDEIIRKLLEILSKEL